AGPVTDYRAVTTSAVTNPVPWDSGPVSPWPPPPNVVPPPPPAGPGPRGKGRVVAAIVAVLVVLGATAGVIVALSGGKGSGAPKVVADARAAFAAGRPTQAADMLRASLSQRKDPAVQLEFGIIQGYRGFST